MKKLLSVVIIMLAFVVQANANHWVPNQHAYATSMTFTGIIKIDGVEQTGTQLEIGAFCGYEVRGSAMLSAQLAPMFGHYYVFLTVYGDTGHQITFHLYDHATQTELDLLCSNTVTFEINGIYGNPGTPYVFDFVTSIATHTITATANPSNGGTIQGAGTYDHGENCTLIATANTGYAFSNWTENGTVVSTNASYTFAVTGDRDLMANFTNQPVNYTINVSASPAEGGSVTGGGTYQQGNNCTVTATANTGYTFVNWTEDNVEVSTNATYTFAVNGNRDLVAHFNTSSSDYHWEVNIHTYPNSMTVTGVILIDGVEQTSTAIEIGIFCGNECRGHAKISDRYNVAPFFRCYVMPTIYGNNGDALSFKLYDHATQQELDLTCTNTLTFTENGQHGNLINPYVFNFVTAVYYDVNATADPTNGGTINGAGSYEENTNCTLTAVPNEGYDFVNWTLNGAVVSTDAEYTFTVTQDVNLVAHFALKSYQITAVADPTAGGTISGTGTFNHFSSCTLTATPNTGYDFVNWTLNGVEVSINASYTFTVMGAAEYVAHFALKSYEITTAVDPVGTGTVQGPGTYNHFSTCTLTATPATGFHFENWTLNGNVVSNNAEYSFEVTGPAHLVAHFTINSYEITASAEPTIGGTVSGVGIYNHFSNCTLTATPATGFHFENWTLNGNVVSDNASYTFQVTGPANYVANFTVNNYQITATVEPEGTGTVIGTGFYNHFSTCELTAVPAEGYHFVNWTMEGMEPSTDPEISFTVTGPASLVAHFEINSYEITLVAHPTIGGTVSGGGTFTHGTSITITAQSNEHFTFGNWSKNGVEITNDSIYTFTVTEEATYTANFERITQTQITDFNQGWTWYSSYIEQSDIDGLSMLTQSLGTVGTQILGQTANYQYLDLSQYGMESMWYGSLEEIGLNNESSYKVQTTAPCVVNMTGTAIHPSAHPITIVPGWNWIGYPSNATIDFDAAFGINNITPHDGDRVKSQTMEKQYNDWGFVALWWGSEEFDSIRPGMGMMYYSSGNEPFTLIYPEGEERGYSFSDPRHNGHWTANSTAYPDNMSVALVVELDDEEVRSDNYEIAVFANGECRGTARLNYLEPLDRYYAMLVVAGDEAAVLNFGLYDMVSGEEIYSADEHLIFANNAAYGSLKEPFVVHFRGTTGVNELESRLHVYPNPVARGEVINLGLSTNDDREVRVEIINAVGAVLRSETSALLPASIAAPSVPGVYTLRIIAEGKEVCHRKLIVR